LPPVARPPPAGPASRAATLPASSTSRRFTTGPLYGMSCTTVAEEEDDTAAAVAAAAAVGGTVAAAPPPPRALSIAASCVSFSLSGKATSTGTKRRPFSHDEDDAVD